MEVKPPESVLLEKLLSRDDTALAILYETHASDLLHYFRSKFSATDEHLIQDCICDSLIEFAKQPERYKPAKGSALKTYLIRDINGNILNKLDKESRRVKNNKTVALLPEHGNNEVDTEDELFKDVDAHFLKGKVEGYFKSVFDDAIDEKLAWMTEIEKLRETSAYVQLLKIEHLNTEEQRTEVKKHKDRIGAQLRRKGWPEFIKNISKNANK
jgi:DNA-directed RNA polymerase specialized sigma24 family protein